MANAVYIRRNLEGQKPPLLTQELATDRIQNIRNLHFFTDLSLVFVDAVFAQSEVDKTRLTSLGAKNVFVVGNIKQSISSFEVKKNSNRRKAQLYPRQFSRGRRRLSRRLFGAPSFLAQIGLSWFQGILRDLRRSRVI